MVLPSSWRILILERPPDWNLPFMQQICQDCRHWVSIRLRFRHLCLVVPLAFASTDSRVPLWSFRHFAAVSLLLQSVLMASFSAMMACSIESE